MNVSRIIIIVILGFFSVQSLFGQTKDEAFSAQTDPVKLIQLFPNPASEFLTVKFEYPVANQSKFTFRTIIGNEINLETEVIDEFEVRFKVKDIHEGYYFLSIQNEQSGLKSTHKFLKR
jgi:hypothetical protein